MGIGKRMRYILISTRTSSKVPIKCAALVKKSTQLTNLSHGQLVPKLEYYCNNELGIRIYAHPLSIKKNNNMSRGFIK